MRDLQQRIEEFDPDWQDHFAGSLDAAENFYRKHLNKTDVATLEGNDVATREAVRLMRERGKL